MLSTHRFPLLASLLLFSFAPNSAIAQTDSETECMNLVQGKVAWDLQGSRDWETENLQRLCKGVIETTKRISCFEKSVNSLGDGNKAINSCANVGGIVSRELVTGKQCVYNKGGYILNVDWYDPGLVYFTGGDMTDPKDYSIPKAAKPKSSDTISLGYESCSEWANQTAVVRIQDYSAVNSGLAIGVGVAAGIASGVGAAAACVGTVGAGCVAAIAVPVVAGAAIEGTLQALPDVEETVYIGSPGTDSYMDFYGTVWDVGISNDVALSEVRKPIEEAVTTVSDFITDGEPGPKSITFNNQAGYVAEMVVTYFQDKDIAGQKVPMPVVKTSGHISVGFSKHIDIPANIAAMPITVFIQGVGTLENDVYATSVAAEFTGNKCFKSWGTIFDTEGGSC